MFVVYCLPFDVCLLLFVARRMVFIVGVLFGVCFLVVCNVLRPFAGCCVLFVVCWSAVCVCCLL